MARAAQAVIDEVDELADLLCPRAGPPARRGRGDGARCAAVETLQWLAEEGPRILARRAHRVLAHPAPDQARALDLRAARRGRRPRPGGRAVRHAAGRRRRRADGRQRRRPQAVAARARWPGERIARIFARAGLPGGPAARRARPRRRRRRARRGARGRPGALHRLGARRARRRRGVRARAQAQRARARRQGRDARAADANVAALGARRASGARSRTPGSAAGASSARTRCPRWPTASSPPWSRRARGRCAWATRADPTTEIGPLVTARARSTRVRELVDEAVAAGATLHCGGPVERRRRSHRRRLRAGRPDAACPPACGWPARTVPGPVLVVEAVADEDDGDRRGQRRGSSALGASVWTADRFSGERIARELRAGMVWMNDHLPTRSAPQVPWGGVGGSGLGRARGAIALRTCAEPKVVTWDPPVGRPGLVVPLRRGAGPRGPRRRRAALGARRRPRARLARGRAAHRARHRALAAGPARVTPRPEVIEGAPGGPGMTLDRPGQAAARRALRT